MRGITNPSKVSKGITFVLTGTLPTMSRDQAAALIKAKGGKVFFRGFKGRYRLTWKNRDGKLCETLVDVK